MINVGAASFNKRSKERSCLTGINYNYISNIKASFNSGFVAGAIYTMGLLATTEGQESEKTQPEGLTLMDAKTKIKAFFEAHHGETIDYSDLMDSFDYPLPLIVDACDALEREGKIAGVD